MPVRYPFDDLYEQSSCEFKQAVLETVSCSNEVGDPTVVICWNEAVLNQRTPDDIENPKQIIIEFMINNGGIAHNLFRDKIISFREFSILGECKRLLSIQYPWLFTMSSEQSAFLGQPLQTPIANTAIFSKTERVDPDVAKFEFFHW